MLQLASVLCRNILGNTSLYELSGKELVLFIDLLGDLLALLCEGECAIVLFYQAFLFRQFFDSPAHRRLFYIQKLCHVYAASITLLLLKHQHSL